MKRESAGPFRTLKFVWSTTFLSVVLAMLTILLTTLATALGTFLGNLTLFWVIGTMAKRQERENQEKLQELQRGYLEMVQRENERLKRYAQMES